MQDKIDQFRARLKDGVKFQAVSQLFPTPREIAGRAVELLEIDSNTTRILEPSAGLGDLLNPIPLGPLITAIERNQSLCDRLSARRPDISVYCADFLTWFSSIRFDRVIMNPPFENGVDIKHVEHAFRFLKSDGILVAIVAGGPRQERAFKDRAEHWEHLPSGTFNGTGVNSVLMRIRHA